MVRSNQLDNLIFEQTAKTAPTPHTKTNYRESIYQMIKGKTLHPFSSFLARPEIFTFENQVENEEIILVLRQHWLTNFNWIVLTLLMSFAPALLTVIPVFDFLSGNQRLLVLIYWYLLTFLLAFERFLSWWFNVLIITDERVVDIDFYNLLQTKLSDAELNKIQDVTYEIGGISQTFFNYGNITIQTAAETKEIEANNIPNPDLVTKVLQTLRLEEQQEELEGRIK